MAVTNCGFQSGGFQSDAFQVCTVVPPVPVIIGGAARGGHYSYPVYRKIPDDDEAIVLLLLELLDD